MPKLEPLNYTDTSRLIDALVDWIHKGNSSKYNIQLLLKLERNKRILYETLDEGCVAECQGQ